MMEPVRPEPLYSSRADDPEAREAIDAFVLGLAERIDHLQDVERGGALREVAGLACELGREAQELGYAVLAEAAWAAETAAKDGKLDQTHKRLIEVTDFAHRVRLGHRGAL